MKDFQKKIGNNTLLTVHKNQIHLSQDDEKRGLSQIRLPLSSLLQVVSEIIQNDLESGDETTIPLILATPYINRALQNGASVMHDVPEKDVQRILTIISNHPQAKWVNTSTYVKESLTERDIIIMAKSL